jgi:hypothetical protein
MTISEVDGGITKCSKGETYLLPLITKHVDIEFSYLLLNCFIKFNKHVDGIERPFGILFELEDTEAFKEYNEYLMTNRLFIKSFIINLSKKLYIFRFPSEYSNEYDLFKEGRYSKFDAEAKKLIISYSAEAYKYPPLIEDLAGVLWKHKSRKAKIERQLGMAISDDSELASRLTYCDETFYFSD